MLKCTIPFKRYHIYCQAFLKTEKLPVRPEVDSALVVVVKLVETKKNVLGLISELYFSRLFKYKNNLESQ